MNREKCIIDYTKDTKQGYISFDNITLYFDNNNGIKFKKIFSNKIDIKIYNKDIINEKKCNICSDVTISSEAIVSNEYKDLIKINKAEQKHFNSTSSYDFELDKNFEKELILMIESKLI